MGNDNYTSKLSERGQIQPKIFVSRTKWTKLNPYFTIQLILLSINQKVIRPNCTMLKISF